MYILIVNTHAGHGKADRIFQAIQKEPVFKERNCRSFRTSYEGHGQKLAEQIAEMHHEHLKCVIVIGGDGTLHEVVNGLHAYPSIPIAFIPAGSGNDFARGIKSKLKGVALFKKIVRNPKRMSVHLGRFTTNKRYRHGQKVFVNNIGFGLDGELIQFTNQPKFRKWIRILHLHRFIYTVALLPVLRDFQPRKLEIEIDGEKQHSGSTTLVAVTNHPYYGGGMKIAPDSDMKRRTFSVTIIEDIPKWKVLAFFLTVFFGKHTKLKEVRTFEAGSVKVTSKAPVPFQVDGQPGECFQCEVKKDEKTRNIYFG
ncbi:diacylglycerol kinase family lipid kinase [Halobacillus litoralis]|uniref:diacylglycerol/lipid kinase family protein n=1 Tax=Halobacillus litoralis TaxID=45668 RepID=UPI001CD6B1F5|nr:diacylglycerol kinase family protein [Halobacillus litoralis]MCA0972754.1 diacylglycerol kinase family lipid kinase [Halobacillus litoralis]